MRILDNKIYRAEKFKDAKAAYELGVIYHTGDRVEPNPEEARRWLEHAADQGHEEAARLLAGMKGERVKPRVQSGGEYVQAEKPARELPPVIEERREQTVDFGHDLVGGQTCPHGHGLLVESDWDGHPRCWVCGWPDESAGDSRTQSEPAAPQPAGPVSKVAAASGVLGVLGFITGGLTSLPAILLGYLSRHQLKQPGPRHSADEFLTKMGLATGWAGLVINMNYLMYVIMNLLR